MLGALFLAALQFATEQRLAFLRAAGNPLEDPRTAESKSKLMTKVYNKVYSSAIHRMIFMYSILIMMAMISLIFSSYLSGHHAHLPSRHHSACYYSL